MNKRPADGRERTATTTSAAPTARDSSLAELKVILRGAAFAAAGLLLSKLFFYATRLAVARLGVEDYGLFSIALLTANFAFLLAILGVDQALLTHVSQYAAKRDYASLRAVVRTGFKIALPASVATGALLFLAAPFLAESVFHAPRLQLLLEIMAFGVPLTVFTMMCAAIFRGLKRVELEAGVRSVAENAFKLAFVAGLVHAAGWGVQGAAVGIVAGAGAAAAIAWLVLKKTLPRAHETAAYLPAKTGEYPAAKLLNFSLPLALVAIAYAAIPWIATTQLGISKTPAEVGVLNAASPTGELMLLLPLMLFALFIPALSSLTTGNRKAVRQTFSHITKWVFMASLPLALLLSYYATQVLTLLFGSQYAQGAASLQVIVAGYLAYSLLLPAVLLLQVLNRPRSILASVTVGVLACAAAGAVLTPVYGTLGAAASIAIAMAAYGATGALMAKRAYSVSITSRYHVRIAAAGIIALAILSQADNLVTSHPLAEMAFLSLLFLAVYAPLLHAFKCFDDEDNDIMHATLRKLARMMGK
ncbi:MAG: oligosaccharide flippase family protein [Candidatus Micrarchaeota archaeon]